MSGASDDPGDAAASDEPGAAHRFRGDPRRVVSIQAIGAFCYPNSRWDEIPAPVGQDPARLWDWRDSPVARSLAAGPRIGPAPKFYREIRKALGMDASG